MRLPIRDLLRVKWTSKRLAGILLDTPALAQGLYLEASQGKMTWSSTVKPRKEISVRRRCDPHPTKSSAKDNTRSLHEEVTCKATVCNDLYFRRTPQHNLTRSQQFRQWMGWHCKPCQIYANAIITGSNLMPKACSQPPGFNMLATQPPVRNVELFCTEGGNAAPAVCRNEGGITMGDIISVIPSSCAGKLCFTMRIPDYIVLTEDDVCSIEEGHCRLECTADPQDDTAFHITRATKDLLVQVKPFLHFEELERLRQDEESFGRYHHPRTLLKIAAEKNRRRKQHGERKEWWGE